MTFDVYSITHRATGREYIGVTSRGVERRWKEHRQGARTDMPIARAIAKYGADAFDYVKEATLPTFQEMLIAERIAIAFNRPAFNLTAGGDGALGAVRTPEQRAKLSAAAKARGVHPGLLAAAVKANTGRKHSEETKAKIGAANLGQRRTPEQRARMSAVKQGHVGTRWTDERREIMRAKLTGRKRTPEQCARIRAAAIARAAAKRVDDAG